MPDSDLIIRNGTPIIISLLGIGRDARYFPEPERFWPERFQENVKQYDENAFIPFGEGPRMCIGKFKHMHVQYSLNNMICYSFDNRPQIGKNDRQGWPGAIVAIL